MGTYNTYPSEQQEFLKVNAPLMSRRELTERFNIEFGTKKTVRAIKSYCNARGYNSSSDGKFQKGNVSWQTGLSSADFKAHYTEESYARMFNAMYYARDFLKVGDETVKNGEPWIVTSVDYNLPLEKRRIQKRRYVWQQLYGEIPQDHVIVCLDGDPMNCEPSNLYSMPKKFVPILGKSHWWFGNAEMTLAAIKWCELYFTIKEVNSDD